MPSAADVGKIIARGIGSSLASPQIAGGALRRVLELAIDGYGRLPGAKTAAARHLQRHNGSVDDAIDSIIDTHVKLASAGGFVTNIGGIAALAITVPANLAGVAVLQVRMVAAFAHLRGYDVNDNRVRTALVMCLLGGEQIAQRIVEGKLPTSPMTVATAPMFDAELDRVVAEEVTSGLASRVGGRNMALIVTKRVPLLGGGVGAVMDGYATRQVGRYAKSELLRRRALNS